MSLMKRMALIFRSKANKAMDRMEDPRETLDYSYQRQLELLQNVRRGVADVATSRKRIELQITQLNRAVEPIRKRRDDAPPEGIRRHRHRSNEPDDDDHREDCEADCGPKRPTPKDARCHA